MIFQHVQRVLVHLAVVNADSSEDSRYSHFNTFVLFSKVGFVLICTSTVKRRWPKWTLCPLRHVQRPLVHEEFLNENGSADSSR